MQIGRLLYQETPQWCRILDGRPTLLKDWHRLMARGIEQGWDALRNLDGPAPVDLHEPEIHWLPPVTPTAKIFCVGVNYGRHLAESGRTATAHPSLFLRHYDSFVGHRQSIVKPSNSSQFDFEGELAVVIGRSARHVHASDAMAYVAGYTCMAENSLRDFQKHTTQVTAGKNFEHSGGIGPWIVPRDIVASPGELNLTTRLNGQVVQQARVAELIFPIPQLIAYISSFTTLHPGDLIATGTPEGVGFKRQPPLFMKEGDHLEVEVDQVGALSTRVSEEPATKPL